MAGMDGSCSDEERSAQLGYKVCKPGQENCQAPVLFVVPAVKSPVIPSGWTILASYQSGPPRSNAESFWRPPRV